MMKYERLTQWTEKGASLILDGPRNEIEAREQLMEKFKLACNRLAELEDKIEQGTLIELPCKVGDTVYFAVDNGWDCAEIDEIHIFKDDIVFEWVQYDRGYELTELWDCGDFSIKDIGKTVFLTREEAEKKLKELQNG